MTKLKKSINLLLVLFAVLAMLFTFTACDDDDDNNGYDEEIDGIICNILEAADTATYTSTSSGLVYIRTLSAGTYTVEDWNSEEDVSVTISAGTITITYNTSSKSAGGTAVYDVKATFDGKSYTLYFEMAFDDSYYSVWNYDEVQTIKLNGVSYDPEEYYWY